MFKRFTGSVLTRTGLPLLNRLPPEAAHDLGLAGLRLVHTLLQPGSTGEELVVRCMRLRFRHPLGLAAGFDKNGDNLDALGALGFSHVELGTVTPRPQPGNPKPRMFRQRARGALVNRMGFNNKGVDHLVARLTCSRFTGVRGVSIGKNFDTPLEAAAGDYLQCLRKVYAQADYVAINVSSPNTARLRELQQRAELERLVGALLEERARLEVQQGKYVPLLVKIAPNLDAAQFAALTAALRALPVDGVIATNTSTDLGALGAAWPERRRGGLSGAPLHARSVEVIGALRAALGREVAIVGVGGIMDAASALASLQAGADLIQVYTGFAYRGPALLQEVLDALAHVPH